MKLQNFENLVGVELEKFVENAKIIATCPHDGLTKICFRVFDNNYIFGGCGLCKDILEKEPIQIADANEFWFNRLEKLIEESGEITNDGPNKSDKVAKFKMDYREASGRDIADEELGAYIVGKVKENPQVSRDFTCRIKIYDRPDELDFIKSVTDHQINVNKDSSVISFADTATVWALVSRGMKFFENKAKNGEKTKKGI